VTIAPRTRSIPEERDQFSLLAREFRKPVATQLATGGSYPTFSFVVLSPIGDLGLEEIAELGRRSPGGFRPQAGEGFTNLRGLGHIPEGAPQSEIVVRDMTNNGVQIIGWKNGKAFSGELTPSVRPGSRPN
jgi:hypothetical protein